MNMVARFWLLLSVSYYAGHTLVLLLVWQSIDLRLETVAQVASIPLMQALALGWLFSPSREERPFEGMKTFFLQPVVLIVLCLKAGLLLAYWLSLFGEAVEGMVLRLAGLETLLGAGVILLGLLRSHNAIRAMASSRILIPFSLLFLALGSNAVTPWLKDLPGWLPDGWSLLLRQAFILFILLGVIVLFTGKVQDDVAKGSPLSASVLAWMPFFLILAAISLGMNFYLFSFPAKPWITITITSLSLGATCLLLFSISLWLKPALGSGSAGRQVQAQKLSPDLLSLWLALALCALAAAVLIRILFFPYWDLELRALLPLALIPLVQASWLRMVRALRHGWRFIPRLVAGQWWLWLLLLMEAILFGVLAPSMKLWEGRFFTIAVVIWVGLKMVVLGVVFLRISVSGRRKKTAGWICGSGAVILGAGMPFTIGFPEAPWILAACGSAFLMLPFWRDAQFVDAPGLAKSAAEACLALPLVMALCTLLTWSEPMGFLAWITLSLIAFSTTFSAMALWGRPWQGH